MPVVAAQTDELQFLVSAEEAGERLDRLVARHSKLSRRQARILISTGRVTVGGRVTRILTRPIRAGTEVTVGPETAPAPAASALRVLYLDASMAAIDKPAGLLSESDRIGSPAITREVARLLSARGERHTRLWLVHRLDAGTSGVMLLARSPEAADELSNTFAAGKAEKTYLALCAGRLVEATRIEGPIGRIAGARHGVMAEGKPATTLVEVLRATDKATLVQVRPLTGRTHQVRVHLAHVGHPLWGDRLYGGPGYTDETPPEPIGRPMLHARRITVPHPETRHPLVIEAAPPEDFQALARALGVWP